MDFKMQEFISQINSIKMKYFQSQDKIDLLNFSQLLKEIQEHDSTLEVTEENSSEIFQMLDHDNDGFLNFNEVEQLLNTILPVYEESLTTETTNENFNRGSLFWNPSQKKFTYERNKGKDAAKIASSILNNLSLDKISELKYIYHLADKDKKGFAEFERIRNLGVEISNQLTLTPFEIESIFSSFKEEKSNKIHSEHFSKLLSELEKRIFNYYNDNQESSQGPSHERNATQTQLDLMIQDSESENEDKEEYQIKEIYLTISTKYIALLVQKLDEAFGLKIKNQFLTQILQDLRKVVKSLENKLLHAEEKIEGFIKIYQESKESQDHSMTKMKAFEFDCNRQIAINESLEEEILRMENELKRSEEKMNRLERINQNLSRRNQEIEVLETKLRSLLKENHDLKEKCRLLTTEKAQAVENYQLVVDQINEKSSMSTNELLSVLQNESAKTLEVQLENAEKRIETLEVLYKMKEKDYISVLNEKEKLEKEIATLKIENEQNETAIINTKSELSELKENYNLLKEDYDYLKLRPKSPELGERKSSIVKGLTLGKDLKTAGLNDFGAIFNERTSLFNKFRKGSLAVIEEKGEIEKEEKQKRKKTSGENEKISEFEGDMKAYEPYLLSEGKFIDQDKFEEMNFSEEKVNRAQVLCKEFIESNPLVMENNLDIGENPASKMWDSKTFEGKILENKNLENNNLIEQRESDVNMKPQTYEIKNAPQSNIQIVGRKIEENKGEFQQDQEKNLVLTYSENKNLPKEAEVLENKRIESNTLNQDVSNIAEKGGHAQNLTVNAKNNQNIYLTKKNFDEKTSQIEENSGETFFNLQGLEIKQTKEGKIVEHEVRVSVLKEAEEIISGDNQKNINEKEAEIQLKNVDTNKTKEKNEENPAKTQEIIILKEKKLKEKTGEMQMTGAIQEKIDQSPTKIKNESKMGKIIDNPTKKADENLNNSEIQRKKPDNPFFEKIDTLMKNKPQKNENIKPINTSQEKVKTQRNEEKNPENYVKTQPEYKFLQFDEASLFARDYLSLREDPRIIDILKKNNEDMLNFSCFSDYMFRINHREHKEKRILFITSRGFYNIHPKRFEVLRRVPIEKIVKTSISDKSAFLIAIHFKNDFDYLIETYRRADMVLYLMEIFKKRGLAMFDRAFGPQFSIKNRGSNTLKTISNLGQVKENIGMQEMYKNSMKIGILEMQRNSWWNPWKEYFFVLTKDVGLMVFRKQGDGNTRNIIKITGSMIVETPAGIDKPFCIKIVYPENNEEYIVSAHSYAEKMEWIEAFHKFQKEAEKKKKFGHEK